MRAPFALLTTLSLAPAITGMAATRLPAQGPPPGPAASLDSATRARVIAGVLERLEEGYVFPARATTMAQAVRRRERSGAYDRISEAHAFADTLTADLRAVSHDLHLRVVYQPAGVQDESAEGEPGPAERRAREAFGRKVNYGFERVERLAGNVGYLEIRSFDFDAALVDSTLAAAMAFLGRTDALIVDVRRNGGGEPAMVAAVCSYFMPAGRVINRFYWRPADRWDESRTHRTSGPSYGTTKPVYVRLRRPDPAPGRDRGRHHRRRGAPGRDAARHRAVWRLGAGRPSGQPGDRDQLGRGGGPARRARSGRRRPANGSSPSSRAAAEGGAGRRDADRPALRDAAGPGGARDFLISAVNQGRCRSSPVSARWW
jgi:hypothetical protein